MHHVPDLLIAVSPLLAIAAVWGVVMLILMLRVTQKSRRPLSSFHSARSSRQDDAARAAMDTVVICSTTTMTHHD